MKNAIKAAIVALAMSTLAVGGVSANTYFWRSGPHLLPYPSSVTDPGDGEPTAQHITLSHDMPSEVIAGQAYSAHLDVSGNDGRSLTYSVEPSVPVFISVTEDGEILIDPIAADVGEHAAIVFTVFDGTTSFHTDPVSITVLPATSSFSLPMVASGAGTSLDRSLVFDGNDTTKITLSANGDSVVATYAAPIAAKGALVSASGNASFAIDAFVGSAWKTAVTSGVGGELDQDVNAADGRSLVSTKWRLRKVSGGSMDLREFRPGSAPANPVPIFDLPSAALASNGQSAVISAFSPSTYYSSAPVTISMAAGTVVPDGVTLGTDGTISVAADAILSGGTWNFNVVATDGSGFTSTRSYSVISVADPASTIMAKDFSNDGTAVGHQGFYDGSITSPATVAEGKSLVVDFGVPVQFDKAFVAFGAGQALRIDYESNSQWAVGGTTSNSSAFAGDVVMSQTIVARRVKVINTGSVPLQLAELRVGSGAAQVAPTINQSGIVATLAASATSVQLTAVTDTHYANTVSSPVFELASLPNTLPSGAALSAGGLLTLPSKDDVTGDGWDFTVKVTDGAGFSSTRDMRIAVPTPDAATVLPTVMKRGHGSPITDISSRIKGMYDESSPFDLSSSGDDIFVTFSGDVSVSSLYANTDASYGGSLSYSITGTGGWISIPGSNFTKYKSSNTNFTPVVARYFKVTFSSSGNISSVILRVGGGPKPLTIDQSGTIATLQDSVTTSVQMTASHAYGATGALTWSIMNYGGLGTATTLTINPSTGLLTLPVRPASPTPTSWNIRITVTDSRGFIFNSPSLTVKRS